MKVKRITSGIQPRRVAKKKLLKLMSVRPAKKLTILNGAPIVALSVRTAMAPFLLM